MFPDTFEQVNVAGVVVVLLGLFGRVFFGGGFEPTLRAQDWSRLRIQSLLYRSQGPLGKDYFRTTIFFPANFVTLLAVI